jgi:hypothetical protein
MSYREDRGRRGVIADRAFDLLGPGCALRIGDMNQVTLMRRSGSESGVRITSINWLSSLLMRASFLGEGAVYKRKSQWLRSVPSRSARLDLKPLA